MRCGFRGEPLASIEFIWASTDLVTLVKALEGAGLDCLFNRRHATPDVEVRPATDLLTVERASFYALRSEWIFGELLIKRLQNTVTNEYYFDVAPRVNFSCISFSFYPPAQRNRDLLFGWGDADTHSTWRKEPEGEIRSAPSEVGLSFKQVISALRKGGTVMQTRYGKVIVMANALSEFSSGTSLMPHAWLQEEAVQRLGAELQ